MGVVKMVSLIGITLIPGGAQRQANRIVIVQRAYNFSWESILTLYSMLEYKYEY